VKPTTGIRTRDPRTVDDSCRLCDIALMGRLLLGLTVTATLLIAGATDALANSFGSNFLTGSCCTIRGIRSDIRRDTLNSPSGAFAVIRVYAQESSDNNGLIQVGYTTSSGSGDNCGNFSGVRFFYEWNVDGSTAFHCQTISGAVSGTHRFTVARVSPSTSGQWQAFLDGTARISPPPELLFQKAGRAGGGGEISASGSNVDGCYGCSGGTTPFQRSPDICCTGANWITIQNATKKEDTGWTVGNVPSPYGVIH
jgi:hypothetical protein